LNLTHFESFEACVILLTRGKEEKGKYYFNLKAVCLALLSVAKSRIPDVEALTLIAYSYVLFYSLSVKFPLDKWMS